MHELFVPKDFKPGSITMIDRANEIIDEYRGRGFVLSLRQLYYQFVARDWLPNRQSEYKRLGSVVNDARLAGLIDWEMIEDRQRELEDDHARNWESPAALIQAAADQFLSDIWARQPYRVEVWIEKAALTNVIEPACRHFRVPYFACRGYSSQSEQWRAGHRIRRHIRDGQKTLILHLGDHDPSGLDMTRDNDQRLRMFARAQFGRSHLTVKRIALNMDQIEQYNPPPNPAKMTDSRFEGYMQDHGDESWELDALDPDVIDGLIRRELDLVVDTEAWREVLDDEQEARRTMQAVAGDWDHIVDQYR